MPDLVTIVANVVLSGTSARAPAAGTAPPPLIRTGHLHDESIVLVGQTPAVHVLDGVLSLARVVVYLMNDTEQFS